MPNSLKQTAVLYLGREKFDFYSPGKNIFLNLIFQTKSVKDLEIINKEELEKEIKAFISLNKISPSNLVIVLAENMLFRKNLTQSGELKEAEVKNFVENIPFNDVFYKTYNLDNQSQIIATNKDFYQVVKNVFEKQGFKVDFVTLVTKKTNLDFEMINFLYKNHDLLKQENFFEIQEINNISNQKKGNEEEEHNNPRLFFLLAIFIFLGIILIYLFLSGNNKKTTVLNNSSDILPTLSILPTITLVPSPLIKNIELIASEAALLRVEILSRQSDTKQAQILKDQLKNAGFSSVKISTSSGIISQKTLLLLSRGIQQEVQNKMTGEIKKTYPEISIQENNDLNFDVIIIPKSP